MKTDLIVVGGGIVGLASAFLAHEQGLSVRVIDRSQRPVGSSIQNFGHACFTGQADAIQPVAMKAREGWIKAAEKTGLWAAQLGTYIPAVTDAEMQVLTQFAEHRGTEQATLLSRADVATRIGNPDLQCVGGAHLPLDMRVNPREAAPKIAEWLANNGVQFSWGHEVKTAEHGTVTTNRGSFGAERVIVCPGYSLTELFPQYADAFEVRVCTLTMALIERPASIPRELAMLTGTSLARYDGFTALPGADELRAELASTQPELVDCIANLMATGIDNYLLIGDSHSYDLSPDPFLDEHTSQLLLNRAGEYLGVSNPQVVQRWQGRYADSPHTNLVLEQPDDQTTVAVVTSGIGMTLSFGIADLALNGGDVPSF